MSDVNASASLMDAEHHYASPRTRETLSVVIICQDEERNIRRCLESIKWADEIVIVDSGSTDRTLDIASEYTDRIFHQPWLGFGPQKNFAISKATCDWVLYMEADEWATPEFKEEMMQMLASGTHCNAFLVPYRHVYRGHWVKHAGLYPRYIARLFRRGKGKFRQALRHARPEVTPPVGRFKTDIAHDYGDSIWQYIVRCNNHTWMEAVQAWESGERATVIKMLLAPMWKFVWRYVFKLGFLDGVPGLLLCAAKAFNIFLRYAMLWELERGGWREHPPGYQSVRIGERMMGKRNTV